MVALVTFSLVSCVNAGTLGRRIITINGGIVQLGDEADDLFSDYLDTIYTYGVGAQFPVGNYFVILLNAQRLTTSVDFEGNKGDIATLGLNGGARLQIPIQDLPFTPFVSAQYGYSIADIDIGFEGESIDPELTTSAITIAAGMEFEITERLSVIGRFARVSLQKSELKFEGETTDISDDLDTDSTDMISGAVNFWMTDALLLSGLAAYELEEKTTTYQIALGFSF